MAPAVMCSPPNALTSQARADDAFGVELAVVGRVGLAGLLDGGFHDRVTAADGLEGLGKIDRGPHGVALDGPFGDRAGQVELGQGLLVAGRVFRRGSAGPGHVDFRSVDDFSQTWGIDRHGHR